MSVFSNVIKPQGLEPLQFPTKFRSHSSRSGRPRNFVGQHFWARGYFVSTVGRDEQAIRTYIQEQEREDRRQDQLRFDAK